jgi:DNA-directed RNA polymerase specialized sigma subunit
MAMKKKYDKIPEEKKQAVLEWFYTQYDNTVPTISDVTGISQSNVNKIINKDLKKLKHETGHKD